MESVKMEISKISQLKVETERTCFSTRWIINFALQIDKADSGNRATTLVTFLAQYFWILSLEYILDDCEERGQR